MGRCVVELGGGVKRGRVEGGPEALGNFIIPAIDPKHSARGGIHPWGYAPVGGIQNLINHYFGYQIRILRKISSLTVLEK